MQRPGHRAHGAGQRRGDIGTGRGDHPGGEGGGVHAVLGGRGPVGVDGLDVLGVGLAPPADHEPLDDGLGLVDLALRHHRQALAAGGLGDVGQRHDGGPGQVVARGLLVDVQQRFQAPDGREHGQGGLHVDADVARVHRDGEGFGGRQAGVERTVDQQAPHVPEGDVADQVFDVHPPVAERSAFLVGLGDLRLERDDTFESGYEIGHQAAPQIVRTRAAPGVIRGPARSSPLMPGTADGHPCGDPRTGPKILSVPPGVRKRDIRHTPGCRPAAGWPA